MAETTITGLPNVTTPLNGTERVPMDQNGATVDASTQAIANLAAGAISSAVAAHVAAADPHPGYLTAAEGDAAYVGLSDARLSDAREWTAATIEQAEAETGTATTRRAFTAQRVRQAIAAWWTSASTAAGRAIVEALDAAAQRTLLGLGTADSPSFTGLTITGTAPVVIPHIHGSIAGNFYVHVKNTSGGPLAAGTAVYATGSVGDTDRITVAACDPTDPLKMPAIAVLETTLANNDPGDAVILGELRPFNSNSYQIRDRLYVGTGGALVATPPASGLVQAVGSVVRVNVNTGTILVNTGAAMARVGFTGAYGDLSGLPGVVSTTTAGLAPATGTPSGKYLKDDGTWATVEAGATPAGSGTEIQYRNSSALGAIPNSSVDGATGAVTLARLILAANSAASTPPMAMTGTWFSGGTGTTTTPHFLIEPAGTASTAWSTSGTGLGVNAPSGFAGALMDLQANGTSRFLVGAAGSVSCSQLSTGSGVNVGSSTGRLGVALANDHGLVWSSNNTWFGTIDLRLLRDATGVFAQRDGTNPQVHRIYNTFASATSFERAKIEWASNILRVGTEKGSAGGTARDMELQTDGTTRITLKANGAILFSGIPTSNPNVAGQLWNDGGTLKISAG
jgi:hypothetical protein